ncbi:uncharacterized protein LOC122620585 isoform X2 [Drosophila teissieri]|uniref:uncharacterized protein LOC122620585 isoform X2 n=1 Tax=Drosophila teissieri TaxID=7243 RepID=UPI001CBA58A0|nr:uncharacterized protein LOC122620585 isoform X2 [Drosophila teissieri]
MSHHDHHYVIARSVSAKDQNDPETGGDRNSNDRDFVSKKIFHGRYGQDSPGYRGKAMLNCSHRTEEYSKHSEEDLVLEKELSWSQQSLLSSDRSKSYSQIYSEILEESKERQEKAERAFQVYHINRSKLRGSDQLSLSRGPGSGSYGSSMDSEYSGKLEGGYKEYDSSSTDPSREQVLKNRGYFSCLKEPLNPVSSIDKGIRPKHFKGESNKTELTERRCYRKNQEASHSYSCRLESVISNGSLNTRHRARSCVCGQESYACSVCTAHSRSGKNHSEDYDAEDADGPNCPVNYKSYIPTTATSQSRSKKNYLSSCSTRHRHHPHYHCQRSVPKTYQDRGNSPINIKTRRKTHDYQEPHSEFGTEKVKAAQLGRSGASIGVQCPSGDEIADWTLDTERCDPQSKSHPDDWLSSKKKRRAIHTKQSVYDESPIMQRDTIDRDVDIHYSFGEFTFGKHRSCITADATQRHKDLGQNKIDSQLSNSVALDKSEYNYNQYSYEVEESDNKYFSDKSDPKVSSEEGYPLDQHYVIEEQDLIHEGGPDVSSSEVAKSKSFLSLKIYDADEALMEIPPDFEGPAIILDDDADFLDITLTDDEEKIRAKLMAAALTTRKSTSSISPNSSLKTRPSIEPRSLSYEPSVIFTRRSEVLKDNYAPRPNDRVALLAEKFLKSFSESATDDSGWKPSTQEVCSTEYTLHFFGGKGVTKRGGDTPLLVDRQLLSEEFNRKLHRQLKVIVESFQ